MLLQLIPRLVYNAENEFLDRIGDQHLQIKRDPVTVLTLSALLGASFLGIGTGIASLVTQNQHYSSLRASIDLDTEGLETSLSVLQESRSPFYRNP